jgi:uncharacterized membrane protein
MKAHTFFTWKFCRFGWHYRGKDFWQILLGVVIISRMPGNSAAVMEYRASKGAA